MANRMLDAIKRVEEQLKEVPDDRKIALGKKLSDITFEELVTYQNIQSTSHACGVITLDEAQTLYELLGKEVPTPEKFGSLPLAEKIVVTQMIGELAKKGCKIL